MSDDKWTSQYAILLQAGRIRYWHPRGDNSGDFIALLDIPNLLAGQYLLLEQADITWANHTMHETWPEPYYKILGSYDSLPAAQTAYRILKATS